MYVVFMKDCSMSTALGHFATKLLKAHGIPLYETKWWHWEISRLRKNVFWTEETSFAKSLSLYMEAARAENSSILVKLNPNVFAREMGHNAEELENLLKTIQVRWYHNHEFFYLP